MGEKNVKRWTPTAAGALSLVLLFSSASSASPRWVNDRNDTRGFLDIRAVAHGHGEGKRLKHTMTTFARWRSRDLWCGTGAFVFPKLDREIIVFYRRGKLRAVMIDSDTRESIGSPVVSRPTRRRVAVDFPRKWLRRGLNSYAWFGRTVRRGQKCPHRGGDPSNVYRDRVPRTGRIVHRL